MKKRILSLFLAFLIIFSSIPTVFAEGVKKEASNKELPFEVIEEKGRQYKSFELPELESKRRSRSVQTRAAGDEIPYEVSIIWTTFDLEFPAEGLEMFLIEQDSDITVGSAIVKQPDTNYHFIDNGNFNSAVKSYRLLIEDSVEYDIRLTKDPGSGNKFFMTITQITMPVYKAEWHTRPEVTKPKVEAKWYNSGDIPLELEVPDNNENYYSVMKLSEHRFAWIDNAKIELTPNGINERLLFVADELGMTEGLTSTEYIRGVIINNGEEQKEGKLEASGETPAYYFKVFGDHKTLWRYAMWEVLTVQFKSGEKGKFDTGANDETKPVEIGYDEKVAGNESGRTVDVPTATPLDPEHYEFAGWKVIEGEGADPDKVLTTDEFNAYQFKANTVFE
ncbi:MAG: hypothetical protein Q4Q17_05790, partial [Tissierellia bacterium]|nr:hypothetical protein [Tissierellia bacterium]